MATERFQDYPAFTPSGSVPSVQTLNNLPSKYSYLESERLCQSVSQSLGVAKIPTTECTNVIMHILLLAVEREYYAALSRLYT